VDALFGEIPDPSSAEFHLKMPKPNQERATKKKKMPLEE